MFKTPIFLLCPPPKPLLKRANLDGVAVIVLCLDNFLFLVEESFEDDFVLVFSEDLEAVPLSLDGAFAGFDVGGRDPDLFLLEIQLIDAYFFLCLLKSRVIYTKYHCIQIMKQIVNYISIMRRT